MKSRDQRLLPFIRKLNNEPYNRVEFDDLKISTATIDVRLVNDVSINFPVLIDLLTVVPLDVQEIVGLNYKWPAGTIVGAVCGNKRRGYIPTLKKSKGEKRGFKNSTMVWIWLESKQKTVNVKICVSSLHITGCKSIDHAVEATRYIQEHLQEVATKAPTPIYKQFPSATRIDICMINYNFSLGVAIDLAELDLFIDLYYPNFAYSPYDPNICIDTFSMKVPKLLTSYTIHDNGRISINTNEPDVEQAYENLRVGFKTFYMILDEFSKQ